MIQTTSKPWYSRERERERESYSLEESISETNVVCDANKKPYIV